MNTKFFIVFIILVKKSNLNEKIRKKKSYLTNRTGTSEVLKSLSETEPI